MFSIRQLLTKQVFCWGVALSVSCGALAQAMDFRVAQEGYHPDGPKIAYLENVTDTHVPKVYLYDPNWTDHWQIMHGRTVYKIKPEELTVLKDSTVTGPSAMTYVVDFSAFKTSGNYELRVDGSDVKEPVKVSEYAYWDLLGPVVKMFYFQRCGVDMEDVNKNFYHLACHKNDAVLRTPTSNGQQETLDTGGGWHDSSDYAKHATSTSVALARLLNLYDINPKVFHFLKLKYPYWEPGIGSVPDLLLESRVGLDWLMAMQQLDGGVYSKVAGLSWPVDDVPPDQDDMPRYVFGVTSQDTAAATAAFAIGARAYRQVDLGYAVRNLLAAQRGWKYLDEHPAIVRNDNEPDEANGSYDYVLRFTPKDDVPFRVWAATELYLSTGNDAYQQYFLKHYKDIPLEAANWRNPAMIGFIDYLETSDQDVRKNPQAVAYLKSGLLKLANHYVDDMARGPYGTGMKKFTHESNDTLLQHVDVILAAYSLTADERYRTAATRAVDYLFGINPLGQSYVAGIGTKSVMHPDDRMMTFTGKLLDGFLVNGPDDQATDGRTPKGLGASSYLDDDKAFSSNEPNILYNADLAFVLGALNATYNLQTVPNAPPPTLEEKIKERNLRDSQTHAKDGRTIEQQ